MGGEQVLIIILVVRQRFIMRHTIDPPSGGERADPLTGPKRWGQQVTTEDRGTEGPSTCHGISASELQIKRAPAIEI